jgi:hypothetical protein
MKTAKCYSFCCQCEYTIQVPFGYKFVSRGKLKAKDVILLWDGPPLVVQKDYKFESEEFLRRTFLGHLFNVTLSQDVRKVKV